MSLPHELYEQTSRDRRAHLGDRSGHFVENKPPDETQIGMTATPKETKYISIIAYFGEPVYSYSPAQSAAPRGARAGTNANACRRARRFPSG
jgi:hypothetical protein